VLSTHIVGDLGSGCRDLAIIDRGKIVFRGSPSALTEHARGKAFEITVGIGQEDLGPGIEIVSRTKDGVGIKIRGVAADGRPPAGASVVGSPTLEEAYLAFMAARGRADAALAEEASS